MAGSVGANKIVVEVETDLPCGISLALAPDDVDAPEGLEIRHQCRDGRYIVTIVHDDVMTLKNTLDEILRSLKVAGEVARSL